MNGNTGIWIGTNSGLNWFDGISWVTYNTINSGIPHIKISCVSTDNYGNLWVATNGGGMAKRNNGIWTVYNTDNSELPSNKIHLIYFEENGNQWVSTRGEGMVRIIGTSWVKYFSDRYKNIVAIAKDLNGVRWFCSKDCGVIKMSGGTLPEYYDISNSEISSNCVYSVVVDSNNLKWFATLSGLVQFDDTNWVIYNTSNSPLPSNTVYSIAIDQFGNKWISTTGGYLVKVDTSLNWDVYSAENSGLPGCDILAIAIDNNNTKWLGTDYCGVIAFNELGIPNPITVENESICSRPSLIYPNPTTDRFELYIENFSKIDFVQIYNLEGKIVQQINILGNTTSIDIGGQPSGVYIVIDNERTFQQKLIKTN